eukprot:scaffold733_cov267-Pinguiococcus_pyrenoidosus.AAC.5
MTRKGGPGSLSRRFRQALCVLEMASCLFSFHTPAALRPVVNSASTSPSSSSSRVLCAKRRLAPMALPSTRRHGPTALCSCTRMRCCNSASSKRR